MPAMASDSRKAIAAMVMATHWGFVASQLRKGCMEVRSIFLTYLRVALKLVTDYSENESETRSLDYTRCLNVQNFRRLSDQLCR